MNNHFKKLIALALLPLLAAASSVDADLSAAKASAE
jgi:hypothetical protein